MLAAIAHAGWDDDVDIVFTTDHGELQGDFGLLFKGPYHVDGLMRLPLIWRPAPSAGAAPAVVTKPVGLVDLAPDVLRDRRRRRAARGWRASRCPSTTPTPTPAGSSACSPSGTASCSASACTCAPSPATAGCAPPTSRAPRTTAREGELYDLADDPLQRVNRWDDPALASLRSDLLADLWDHQPPMKSPLPTVEAPV